MKRRTVLWMGLSSLGALAVGWSVLPPRQRLTGGADQFADPESFTPNAWVRIGRDDSVSLFMPRAEMGQGTHTGLAMLLAEELGCALEAIRIEPAPIASVYNNVKVAVREAGAMARETLRAAAARRWNVAISECTAKAGKIVRGDGQALSFGEIVAFGDDALEPVSEFSLKAPADWTLIGTPAKRLEASGKVTGRAQFAADIQEPGMLYAEVALCPYVGGTLDSFDETAARGLPGVVEIVTIPAIAGAPAAIGVVADQRWRAQRAVEALGARWRPGPSGAFDQSLIDSTLVQGLQADAPRDVYREVGEAESIIASAATALRAEYEVPYLAHAAMEPLCCAVKFEGTKATVWAGVQVQNVSRDVAAKVFELDKDQVTLIPMLLGGAFGRRLDSDFIALGAAIGRAVPNTLVQLQWRREHDTRHDFYRPAVRARLSAVVDAASGRIEAYHCHSVGQSIAAQTLPRQLGLPASGTDASNVEGAADQAYVFEHHLVTHTAVELPVGVGFWRSVGHSQHAFFNESFIDELASSVNADPVEFRLRHLGDRPRHAAVLRLVADKAGWQSPIGQTADGRAMARGVALHESFGSIVGLVAEVSEGEGGVPRVHRVVAAIDCGVAVNPQLIAQQLESSILYGLSAALYGRISFKDGQVEQGNFDAYPVIRLAESPSIDTWIVPSTAPPGGVGEPGVPPVAPAVTSALAKLTGRRVRRLPLVGA